uniref:Uncharacterized protein n=1 Tax=Cacopsylla melanoneura TaxID=428564 RepID=A0A8D8Y871_9HEMI
MWLCTCGVKFFYFVFLTIFFNYENSFLDFKALRFLCLILLILFSSTYDEVGIGNSVDNNYIVFCSIQLFIICTIFSLFIGFFNHSRILFLTHVRLVISTGCHISAGIQLNTLLPT